jgi:hypothetical protein
MRVTETLRLSGGPPRQRRGGLARLCLIPARQRQANAKKAARQRTENQVQPNGTKKPAAVRMRMARVRNSLKLQGRLGDPTA